jgi:SAM-dependent methyltransferase
MHLDILDLLVCPDCRGRLQFEGDAPSGVAESGRLVCGGGHAFSIVGGVPRFVQHELNADQARTRDSFGYEWTELYPQHGQSDAERDVERRVFLEYTRTLPSTFRGQLVLDAGCGNGRYAKFVNEWGARVVAVDISSAVDVAAKNLAGRANVDVVQADLFKLPFRDGAFDMAYSVGVLHHTPDACGAFASVSKTVRPGGSFSIFVHARGNGVLHRSNLFLRGFTAKASYKTTWRFSRALSALGQLLDRIPYAGPMGGIMLRQIFYFSSDQHNNFDHYSAGFTSFHTRDEVEAWYRGWDEVMVRFSGVACESLYARGTKPAA